MRTLPLFLVLAACFSESRAAADPAEAMRQWMLGAPAPVEAAAPNAPADPWSEYIRVSQLASPAARESEYRNLLESDPPDDLRRIVLWDMKTDLAYRGREARFIRRYGFYANWFNRFAWVSSRALQGNFQAAGQLVVDGVFDAFGSNASAAERRLYDLLTQMREEESREIADAEEISELRTKVDAAFADVDLERGRAALEREEPDAAVFYARSARAFAPESKKAAELEREAESRIAERRRSAVASDQIGFPDRPPNFSAEAAEAARMALLGADAPASAGLAAEDAFYLDLIHSLQGSPRPAERMEDMSGRLARLESDGGGSAWLARALNDPKFNPEIRLDRAKGDLRANQARYIFLGPEKAREQAYKASSRTAQLWSAVGSIGIFYGLEIALRSVVSGFRPTTPNEDARDAAAEFLRQAPDHPRASETHVWLTKLQADAAKFEKARLAAQGQDGQTIQWSDAQSEKPTKSAKPRKIEKVIFTADWKTVENWAGAPPPCGLPGRAEWFDGDPANGEVEKPEVRFEAADAELTTARMSYFVLRNGGREIVSETLSLDPATSQVSGRVIEWLRLSLEERRRVERDLRQLDRPPFPYEIVGGVGGSGIDFYPRLLPIESRAGELTLYRE